MKLVIVIFIEISVLVVVFVDFAVKLPCRNQLLKEHKQLFSVHSSSSSGTHSKGSIISSEAFPCFSYSKLFILLIKLHLWNASHVAVTHVHCA